MKILIANTLYPPHIAGGAEKSVALLANGLAENGHEVSIVSLHPNGDERQDADGKVTVHRLPMDNIYWPFDMTRRHNGLQRLLWHVLNIWNFRSAGRVGKILDREKPDVVHSNNLGGLSVALWAAARRRGIPVVHTLRDYSLACVRASVFRDGKECVQRCSECKALTQVQRQQSGKVDKVVSISRYVLDAHRRFGYFPEVEGEVIINFAGDLSEASRRPRPAGMPVTFGFLGRVHVEKGIEVLLEAVSLLPADSNWRLVVAGRGESGYEAELKARYPDPRIDWVGFVKPVDFYSQVDTVVVPSIWPEPLSRVILEAISAGRPVLVARTGGMPEIASLAALHELYESLDAAALAGLLAQALAAPEQWAKTYPVPENYTEKASQHGILAAYERVYAKAIAERR